MAKAKSARRAAVKTAVCVRKPGPMADVAIRKAAPSAARRESRSVVCCAGTRQCSSAPGLSPAASRPASRREITAG